jgi:hypothetical protein
MTEVLPKSWESWYRFALEELGLEHDEAIEYANTRYVEEQNRARLRFRAPGPARPTTR